MTWFPKLPAQTRAEFLATVRRKRKLTKLIAKLEEAKRSLPTIRELCEQHGVSSHVAKRMLYGAPYKLPHPNDLRTKTDELEPSDSQAHAA